MNSQYLATRLVKCLKDFLPPKATDANVHDIHLHQEQGTQSILYSFFLTYVSDGSKQQKEFILRVNGERYEEAGHKEFTLLKTLKEHNLPVPTVYNCGANNNKILGKPFMIMEKIAAKNATHFLNDEISAQVIINQMAENLARVHKLDPKYIHNFKVLKEQQELSQQQLLKVMFFIKKGFFVFSPLRQRRFIAAVKRLEEVKPRRFSPAILHGDYHPCHFFVSNGQPIIVDWNMASVGDPAIDVGWTYHVLKIEYEMGKVDLGELFVKRYEKHRGQRLLNLQFCKDMAALKLASWYGMLPFNSGTFGIFLSFVDHTFGNVYGKIKGSMHVRGLQRLMDARNQPSVWSNIEYIQSYVTQYFER